MNSTKATTPRPSTSAAAQRDARRIRRLLAEPEIRVFLPSKAQEGGVFRAQKGETELLARTSAQSVDLLIAEGALLPVRSTKAGRLYRAVPPKQRIRAPRTALDRRTAAWMSAERAFAPEPANDVPPAARIAPESPIGWLARRRDAGGRPFLSRGAVAAAERLRADFERSQLAPCVTQDWKRFLTSGVEGGTRGSAQERDVDNGANAARERLADALDALGPGLSDVALRVCCFLEGIEAIESSMHWSRRSG